MSSEKRLRARLGLVVAFTLTSGSLLAAGDIAFVQDASQDGVDRSISPGDDFYRYANGRWLATPMPTGRTSYSTREILAERTSQQVRTLIQHAAQTQAANGSVAQTVGAYYASFMNEAAIESKGLAPLADEMAAIVAIKTKASLSDYLGRTLNSEVEGLTSNSDHVFGVWINQGFDDADHNFPHLWQGGLGLPSREDYLDASPESTAMRGRYQAHVATILKLAGLADAETRAARVVSLETRVAQAFAPDADAADVFKQDNVWKRADFAAKAPGMDWHAYFQSAGLDRQSAFVVWQPSAVSGVAALVEGVAVEAWQDYLRFHLVEHYAAALPKAVAAEHFAFYAELGAGTRQLPDRAEIAIAATNAALGQAVGRLYTQQYFTADDKDKAQAMVSDLLTAYRARISNLSWMSPETKGRALAKLAALKVRVGYPDAWMDYRGLAIVRDDAVGNMRRAEAFNRSRNLAKLEQPVDPVDWPINPQTPGAIIMFSPNAEYFAAAILQPPYFDSHRDAASNYGSAGAGMAHEISHGFDELGNIYDARGRLGMWWTAADRAQFQAQARRLVAQFDAYCPFSDLCVNGQQVLTENVADLAGLMVAHDAYLLSLNGKPDVVIGGLTGEQRFFLAFAQRWRKAQNEAALRKQIAADSHAPGEYRSDTVRNADAWYQAYKIVPGDKLYVAPEDRVGIW